MIRWNIYGTDINYPYPIYSAHLCVIEENDEIVTDTIEATTEILTSTEETTPEITTITEEIMPISESPKTGNSSAILSVIPIACAAFAIIAKKKK